MPAITRPAAPPTQPSSTLSVTSCRDDARAAGADRASESPTPAGAPPRAPASGWRRSHRRSAARSRRSAASRTSPAAGPPARTRSSASTTAVSAAFVGYCLAHMRAADRVHLAAGRASVTPGFRRPMQMNEFDPGSWSPARPAAPVPTARARRSRTETGSSPASRRRRYRGRRRSGLAFPTIERSAP